MGRFDRLREEKARLEYYKKKGQAASLAPQPAKSVAVKKESVLSDKSAEAIAEALRLMMKE
ncbi:MAG: hypothetical protein JNL74_14315 [Fibrobacteres bacterium]|nr:hypothetical protein [Fibrobacterota bacterium]